MRFIGKADNLKCHFLAESRTQEGYNLTAMRLQRLYLRGTFFQISDRMNPWKDSSPEGTMLHGGTSVR